MICRYKKHIQFQQHIQIVLRNWENELKFLIFTEIIKMLSFLIKSPYLLRSSKIQMNDKNLISVCRYKSQILQQIILESWQNVVRGENTLVESRCSQRADIRRGKMFVEDRCSQERKGFFMPYVPQQIENKNKKKASKINLMMFNSKKPQTLEISEKCCKLYFGVKL